MATVDDTPPQPEELESPPVVDDSTPAPSDPPDSSDPPSDAPPTTDEPGSLQDLERRTGLDLSRYTSADAALEGIAEAARGYGRKNEDAQLAKNLRDTLGEEKLAALLAGDDAPVASPSPKSEDEITINQIREWQLEAKAGELSETDRKKYDKFTRKIEADQTDISNLGGVEGIQKLIAAEVEKLGKQQAEEIKQQNTQNEQQSALQTYMDRNATDLFLDPSNREGGLTDLGKKAKHLMDNHPHLAAMPNTIDLLAVAVELAKGQHVPQQQNTPLKPSRAAQREPAVNATPKAMTKAERGEAWAKANPHGTGADYFEYEAQFNTPLPGEEPAE